MRALTVLVGLLGLVGCSASTSADDTGAAGEDAGVDATSEAEGGLDASYPDVWYPDAGAPSCISASATGSYYGCEHWVADLDNVASSIDFDAAGQPLALSVTNPTDLAADVTVERSTAAVGSTPVVTTVASASVPPHASSTLVLGSLEVDGSTPGGLDDGTHTALTANGLRVRSTQPVGVVAFNPRGSSATFSLGSMLVLPSHVLGTDTTVVGWPQTIADSTDPRHDFVPGDVHDEDLRAFLTIVATEAATSVEVTLGPGVVRVVGGGGIAEAGPGDVRTVTLGAFAVLNLETGAFGADFTGTRVHASAPVAVFSGSEASDVPLFDDLANRLCCGDQLQVQLPPDARAGSHFVVTTTMARTSELNRALARAHAIDTVGDFAEPQSIRVLALHDGTMVTTSAGDSFALSTGQWQDVSITTDVLLDATQPIVVLETVAGQQATGIPNDYPGGDPDLFWVPPVEQHALAYTFDVPEGLEFDVLSIAAPAGAEVWLDGAPLPADCETGAIGTAWAIHRCALSAPLVFGLPSVRSEPGEQHDGFHTLTGTQPFVATVSGWTRFDGYAFTAGASFGP